MAEKGLPKEVIEFLKTLKEPLETAKEALEKARAFIDIGKELGFDVSAQEKTQKEQEERVKKIEEVLKKYLGK